MVAARRTVARMFAVGLVPTTEAPSSSQVQDTWFSSRQQGFESPWGRLHGRLMATSPRNHMVLRREGHVFRDLRDGVGHLTCLGIAALECVIIHRGDR